MQDPETIRSIRLAELEAAVRFLPPAGRVLELGAGAGWQAAALSGRGFEVVALETAANHYPGQAAFPLTEYDGYSIPAADGAFDAVFSSNVLEHVEDLPRLLAETRRVLKDGGIAVHLLPTPAWRLWCNLSHPAWMMQRSVQLALGRAGPAGAAPEHGAGRRQGLLARAAASLLPRRHGERGNVWSEMYYFSTPFWSRTFQRAGFAPEHIGPAGVFYVSAGLLGSRLPLPARRRMAQLLGSSCTLFALRKS